MLSITHNLNEEIGRSECLEADRVSCPRAQVTTEFLPNQDLPVAGSSRESAAWIDEELAGCRSGKAGADPLGYLRQLLGRGSVSRRAGAATVTVKTTPSRL